MKSILSKSFLTSFSLLFLCTTSVQAEENFALIKPSAQSDILKLAIGYYDVLDDQDGIDLRLEYQPSSVVFIDNLHPWAGLELTSHGSIWAGGGLAYDWNFEPDWTLTPSLGIGLYNKGGSDVDLDYPIEFRSQLALSYEYDTEKKVGLALSHLSNANLGHSNPGTEVISLYWSFPF
ncbi:MAG: acyloxyacyl hydrolase [Alphaproteobacteria bacterium]|nr:acyloxyacyl hydrolase [Alphaproteobacteria bacterium]